MNVGEREIVFESEESDERVEVWWERLEKGHGAKFGVQIVKSEGTHPPQYHLHLA